MATKKTVAERREDLRKQMAVLKAREQALAVQESKEQRKLDARRKIVFGAALMTHASIDEKFAAAVRIALDAALTKEADRELLKDWLSVPKAANANNQPPPPLVASAEDQ